MSQKNLLHVLIYCIFAAGPNLIRETGVELCIFDIIDFKGHLPPPYLREVWDYKNANVSHIQSVVSSTELEFLFRGASVKVDILNKCLKIFSTILFRTE